MERVRLNPDSVLIAVSCSLEEGVYRGMFKATLRGLIH